VENLAETLKLNKVPYLDSVLGYGIGALVNILIGFISSPLAYLSNILKMIEIVGELDFSKTTDDSTGSNYISSATLSFIGIALIASFISFLLFPFSFYLNYSFSLDKVLKTTVNYNDVAHKWITDYDIENPCSRKHSRFRLLDMKIQRAKFEGNEMLASFLE
jgi:hypothetical protein